MLYFLKHMKPFLLRCVCVRVRVCVRVCMNVYYGRKKTNKLQVHPYKPVSWLPTHQGNVGMNL